MAVMTPTLTGDLTLGHVLEATGLDPDDVVVLRHTFTEDGLESAADLTPEKVLEYTRVQGIHGSKLGPTPPRHWLVFMANGGRRSRLLVVYDNHGEAPALRSQRQRVFDLQPSVVLSSLVGRLVVEWSRDTVNWAKRGVIASAFPVVEIADPQRVPFPGFDRVLITHTELKDVVQDPRYGEWRTALGAVQGIYLIADTSTGSLYVGKADGGERILGRWAAYARDGHGGNVALRDLATGRPPMDSMSSPASTKPWHGSTPSSHASLRLTQATRDPRRRGCDLAGRPTTAGPRVRGRRRTELIDTHLPWVGGARLVGGLPRPSAPRVAESGVIVCPGGGASLWGAPPPGAAGDPQGRRLPPCPGQTTAATSGSAGDPAPVLRLMGG